MKLRHWLVVIGMFAMVCGALPAGAGQWPHTREGLILGFSVGGGSGAVTWGDENFAVSSDRQGGFAGSVRIGYAFSPQLALAFEGSSWARTFSSGDQFFEAFDETWTLSVGTLALTWYPEGGGFFLRGGIGGGNTEVKFTQENVEVKLHQDGYGGLVGLGYEWRLARRFAFGPELTFGGMNLDHGWKANFTNLSLGFNWYL